MTPPVLGQHMPEPAFPAFTHSCPSPAFLYRLYPSIPLLDSPGRRDVHKAPPLVPSGPGTNLCENLPHPSSYVCLGFPQQETSCLPSSTTPFPLPAPTPSPVDFLPMPAALPSLVWTLPTLPRFPIVFPLRTYLQPVTPCHHDFPTPPYLVVAPSPKDTLRSSRTWNPTTALYYAPDLWASAWFQEALPGYLVETFVGWAFPKWDSGAILMTTAWRLEKDEHLTPAPTYLQTPTLPCFSFCQEDEQPRLLCLLCCPSPSFCGGHAPTITCPHLPSWEQAAGRRLLLCPGYLCHCCLGWEAPQQPATTTPTFLPAYLHALPFLPLLSQGLERGGGGTLRPSGAGLGLLGGAAFCISVTKAEQACTPGGRRFPIPNHCLAWVGHLELGGFSSAWARTYLCLVFACLPRTPILTYWETHAYHIHHACTQEGLYLYRWERRLHGSEKNRDSSHTPTLCEGDTLEATMGQETIGQDNLNRHACHFRTLPLL